LGGHGTSLVRTQVGISTPHERTKRYITNKIMINDNSKGE